MAKSQKLDSQYDTNDHKEDNGDEFEQTRPELFLCIAQCAKDVDYDENQPEDGNPNGYAHSRVPILDSKSGNSQFKRQDDGPLEDVIPAHRKSPGRIDEASRVGVEPSGNREYDGEFSQSIYDIEDHNADNAERQQKSSRTLVGCQTLPETCMSVPFDLLHC